MRQLRRSLQHPHPDSAELAERGPEEWTRGLPEEDAEALVDGNAGRLVQWVCGEGWVEGASEAQPRRGCRVRSVLWELSREPKNGS